MTITGDPPQSDRRRGVHRNLEARIAACSLDELRVLDVILTRLELGRERYGFLALDGDRRDWARERREEALDGAIYAACEALCERDARAAAIASAPELDDEQRTAPRARFQLVHLVDPLVERALRELATAEPVVSRTPARFDLSDEDTGR